MTDQPEPKQQPECLSECHPGGYLHAIACPRAMWNQDAKEEERSDD